MMNSQAMSICCLDCIACLTLLKVKMELLLSDTKTGVLPVPCLIVTNPDVTAYARSYPLTSDFKSPQLVCP